MFLPIKKVFNIDKKKSTKLNINIKINRKVLEISTKFCNHSEIIIYDNRFFAFGLCNKKHPIK